MCLARQEMIIDEVYTSYILSHLFSIAIYAAGYYYKAIINYLPLKSREFDDFAGVYAHLLVKPLIHNWPRYL